MRVTVFSILILTAVSLRATALPSFETLSQAPAEVATGALGAVAGGAALAVRHEAVRFDSLRFLPGRNGRFEASVAGARTFAVETLPQIPIVDRVLALPAGQTARVTLENMQVEETTEAMPLQAAPELYVWGPLHRFRFPKTPVGRYFPGSFLRAADNGAAVSLHFFPVQVETATGKVLALKSADLRIEYVAKARPYHAQSFWGSDSIILTTEKLAPAAKLLADFQLERTGVHSETVTVENIDRDESPVDESLLPDGYKNAENANESVVPWDPRHKTGYHYALARKIINFLQKRMGEGSPLKYVTILGDATMVPPSYYFSIPGDFGPQFGVTDLCYAAREKCGDPRLAVGRLPFRTQAQVENYLAKVRRWAQVADHPTSELALFAGKAFQSDIMVGELASLGILNSEKDDWFGARKVFRTKGNYHKKAVMSMLEGRDPSAFIYYLDHGVGNQWLVERDYVTAAEIASIGGAGPAVNPLIVSISCSNAAFDETLFKDIVFAGSQYGPVSIGTSLLRSKGGSIVYWGAGRPSFGNPIYHVDINGNLNLTGGNYQLQIMNTFYERYRVAKSGILGDLTLAALRAYLFEQGNDMTDAKNWWTYLNMVLLGDPTLRLPVREQLERAYPIARSTFAFPKMGPKGFPFFFWDAFQSLQVGFDAMAPVHETLLKISPTGLAKDDQTIEDKSFPKGGSITLARPESALGGRFFVRLENAEGVPLERQVWFETRPNASSPDGE